MGYDETADTYICHAGKKLKRLFVKGQKSKSGYESEVMVYECEDCTAIRIKRNAPVPKGTSVCTFPKVF